ncbi:MAG: hypothetical protein KC983_01220 [Phycisphaerales bacterium]|nr:hypothetical protein [Phycisphaerales bacterium]
MSLGPIRPRFSMTVAGPAASRLAHLRSIVEHPDNRLVSEILGNHINITVVKDDRHAWSPCVQLEFIGSDDDPDTSIVHGLIGPHPNLWTMFMFINITALVIALFGVMIGIVQHSLHLLTWGYWLAGLGAAILIMMYAISQLGQRRAAAQTRTLMTFIETNLQSSPPT